MELHKENHLDLRNIRSLSGKNFFIPDYQRGYRWTTTQAIEMLNDFNEFIKTGKDNSKISDGYYCLQPIVVKPRSWHDENDKLINGYEVIDGQQRLTTIYLLLTALFSKDNRNKDDVKDFEMFSISYQTRDDSREYLELIADKQYRTKKRLDCIDFYHISMVFEAFISYFENEKTVGFDRSLIELILGEEYKSIDDEEQEELDDNEEDDNIIVDRARNVRVIWYEVGSEERATSEDIFTRLNIGKIPLTNAELIKAMFLKESNFGKIIGIKDKEQKAQQLGIALQQNRLAEEWNYIEQKLQREDFWYFLGGPSCGKEYETRIEFIFDLMSKWNKDVENYHTFNHFQQCIIKAGEKKGCGKCMENSKRLFS